MLRRRMTRTRIVLCTVAASMLALATAAVADDAAGGEDSPLGLSVIETPDLRLVYVSPTLDFLTPHVVRTFTQSLRWQRQRFGWRPSQPVTVLLKDFADYGNAGASPMPLNSLRVEVSPASNAFETNPSSERMYSLMNHELVHIATTDLASSQDRAWRGALFGKVAPQAAHPESLLYSWFTVPRFNTPRWLLEGAAVFMETWMAGGLGRAQGGYDEMVFRAMVRDGAPFYDPLGLASRGVRVDFQVGANAYLYGTRFMTWLALEHSPQKVVEWLRRDEGSRRHYAEQFEQVFGLPLDDAWRQWIAFEKSFQQRNLAEVRKQPITPARALVPRALGSSSRFFVDGHTLYGAFRQAGIVEHVGALDMRDGSVQRLADIKGGVLYSVTSLAFDPVQRQVFYTADNLAWRDLMRLDLRSGEETRLIEDARIGELVFNRSDGTLLGVRHQNGLATLVRIAPPYTQWQQLYTLPYGVVPTDLDVSPDGQRLSASVSEPSGDQFVRIWSLPALQQGRLEQLGQCGFGQSMPEGFVFSPDGRHLVGSSFYTGVSNIFRCAVADGQTEALTNAEAGLFRPLPLADGRLLVLAFTGQGFVPSIIDNPRPLQDVGAIRFLGNEVVKRHPELQQWQVAAPDRVDGDALVTRRGAYQPLREIRLHNAYPVLQGYKGAVGVGYHANLGDPLGFAAIGLTFAVTPDSELASKERVHLEATARYLGWRAALSWNRSDFYDLFGPTKRGRKGFAAKLGYDWPLVYDEPRRLDLKFDLAHYTGIDTLPANQNVASGFRRLSTAEVGLHYAFLRRSLGAVDDEKGLAASTGLRTSVVPGARATQWRAGLDFGWSLPWEHASLWSRSALGVTAGARGGSLGNFYFGGFGNNVIDNGAVKRYREVGSMPGFEIDEIAGRRFVRQMVELNLPPVVFESAGWPGFHATWLRPAVFATALRTAPRDGSASASSLSLGMQWDLRLSVLHWYEMILSAGYGAGHRGGRRAGDEWMLSLKIM
jgi:hypothetical protein